jgi:formylglycine-generating enzyme required for sulfatase activity
MTDCGPGGRGTESCALSQVVPAGTFYRDTAGALSKPPGAVASVSPVNIDKYEITVGRFRQFVAASASGWTPAAGSGKHTHLNGGRGLVDSGVAGGTTYETGWQSAWDAQLASSVTGWDANLSCNAYATWTSAPGANESRPINCVDWYEVYAFCIWDGGFLPSDQEWNYAASGGDEQRLYPWSSPSTSTAIDCSYANYGGGTFGAARYCSLDGTDAVGSQSPKGDGRWGQADLGGNVWEWVLDTASSENGCQDCAVLSDPAGRIEQVRGTRGGGLGAGFSLQVPTIDDMPPTERDIEQGARCGRAP